MRMNLKIRIILKQNIFNVMLMHLAFVYMVFECKHEFACLNVLCDLLGR